MWFLAWKNVSRRIGQTTLTVLITALTVLTFVLSFSVLSTLQEGLRLANARLGADVIVLPGKSNADAFQTIFTAEPVNIYMDKSVTETLSAVVGVEFITPQFFTQSLDESCCSIGGATRLVGYDEETDFILKPWLNEQNIEGLRDDEVIIGGGIPAMLGNRAIILGEIFTVVGSLYPTGSGMDETIFMNIEVARKLAQESPYLQSIWKKQTPEELISALLIKVDNGFSPEEVARNINELDLTVVAVSTSEIVSSMKAQMDVISRLILGLWSGVFVVACLALIGRFTALARERKKEIGLLRAVGVQRSAVFKLIVLEAWIMAGSGGILGSLLGVLGVKAILDILTSSMVLPMGEWSGLAALASVLLGIAVALLLGLLASVYPAWKSARMDPQEAIVRGELD